MLASVASATILGVEGRAVTVEVHVGAGLPSLTIVGLPDASCREVRDRARAAFACSGLAWPQRKVTINLAPSGERKVGTGLDLAIALAVLGATEQVPAEALAGLGGLGELGLDGTIRPVPGVLALASAVAADTVVVPAASAPEARLVPGLAVRPVQTLGEVVLALTGEAPWPDPPEPAPPPAPPGGPDLADVRGQPVARHALEVAAAGGHHLLLVGPPGAGKTMLARRLPGVLPDLDPETALAATRIASIAGAAPDGAGLILRPPFRAPHHSCTLVSMVGGGSAALRPGEVTLATGGVLFLDEMGEYPAVVLDGLRQPLEEGVVRVARARASVTMPARFLLVAATNPCPCGMAARPGACRCSDAARARYLRRLSGPVLDRFDLRVELDRPEPTELLEPADPEPSRVVAERVAAVRALARQRGVASNAAIPGSRLDELAPLGPDARRLLDRALRRGRLTARGLHRVRRVARTIVDLSGDSSLEPFAAEPVALALALRVEPSRALETVA